MAHRELEDSRPTGHPLIRRSSVGIMGSSLGNGEGESDVVSRWAINAVGRSCASLGYPGFGAVASSPVGGASLMTCIDETLHHGACIGGQLPWGGAWDRAESARAESAESDIVQDRGRNKSPPGRRCNTRERS